MGGVNAEKPIRDAEKLEKAWKEAKATHEIEGFSYTKEDEQLIKGVASGKLPPEALLQNKKNPNQPPTDRDSE